MESARTTAVQSRTETPIRRAIERAGLLALVIFYLTTVLPNIGDHPIVGGDEGWIISASAKLAREGAFGSDLFAGFYGAEDHYYFNLPLHHVVVAGIFKVFGVGLAQARLVSVLYGLAALLLTYAFGRRIGGPVVGLASAALLVLLRLNLAPFTGLTLTDLGAIVRYDLITVPYGLGAALLLARRPDAPAVRDTALAGLLLGLGTLTQFLGALFAPPLILFLITASLPATRRLLLVGVLVAAMAAPLVPYGVYALVDYTDFRGQSRTFEQESDVFSPSFYFDNAVNEPDRYALSTDLRGVPDSLRDAARRPSARLTMYVVAPLAAALVVGRARRSRLHLLLALMLVGLPLEMALLESTKRFVYWVVVVPFLCVAVADLGLAAWRWRSRWGPVAAKAAVGLVALLFAAEGLAVGLKGVRDATGAMDYATVGQRLGEVIPPGATVVSDNRLWLTLDGREPRSLLLLFYHTNPRISRERVTDVRGAMGRIDADYLLLSPLTRDILRNLSAEDSAAFTRYLSEEARLVETVEAGEYGPVEVYRLRR